MHAPSVSIVMPVYNAALYVELAIKSVLRQTYTDWELIAVNDGSTDESEDVVATFGNRVRSFSQPNAGPSSARNHGLAEARGKCVAFLDADDEWHPEFLSSGIATLSRSDNSIAGVCSGWVYIDRCGIDLSHTRQQALAYIGLPELLAGKTFPIHAALTRRDWVLKVGGFDTTITAMEDWDLWLRIAAAGGTFRGLPGYLARYRLHSYSNSTDAHRMRAGRLWAVDKLAQSPGTRHDIQTMCARARARALIQSSAALFATGCAEEACADFAGAVRTAPAVLAEDESYYAVICAEQPVGYKATSYPMDFDAAERRVLTLLQTVPAEAGLRRAANASAHKGLAHVAAWQGHTWRALRHSIRALRWDCRSSDIRALARLVIGSLRHRLRPSERPPLAPTGMAQ